MDDFFAEWKSKNNDEAAIQNAWTLDLQPGQPVRACQDIEYRDNSRIIIPFATTGIVIKHGDHTHEWEVRFNHPKHKKHTWVVIYDPSAKPEKGGWCWGSEILPIPPPPVPKEQNSFF